ncbi:MAG TPA: 2'-5' RNA ligase family protein [Verrucomicrobiae bacterium]|jgi:2'-5' RNA ligase
MAEILSEPQATYEALWREAAGAFDGDGPRIDPFLTNRAADKRRGVTLVARPGPEVRFRVEKFLRQVATIAGDQYFYQPEEFHVTVLSVIPGSEKWRERTKRLPEYIAVLDKTLREYSSFSIEFRGVTASRDAIMIQGFPVGDELSRLRNDLREALSQSGLGADIDRRYKIVAAHLTCVRFSKPMPEWQALKAFLEGHRNTCFGTTRVRSLQLIEGDWYASADSVRILREYLLSEAKS